MIRELRIENLLLIERAEMEFGPGFTVLTGETGAGKTVLAHSLDLLTGGRAKKGIVRPGAPEAWVEGVFDMPSEWGDSEGLAAIRERLPADAGELVLGRRVSASGRTSAFIGGRSASAAELALVTERLIAFFGQHEHRKLTISSAQLGILDSAGGDDLAAIAAGYREAWEAHRRATAELERIATGSAGRDPELLRHEVAEIEAANLTDGEKQGLELELGRLRQIDRLRQAAAAAAGALKGDGVSGGAADEAAAAAVLIREIGGVDPELDRLGERLESVAVEMDDLAGEVNAYLGSLEEDPGRLAEVEARLDTIGLLELRYGGSVDRVLEYLEEARGELASAESGEDRLNAARRAVELSEARLSEEATRLGEARRAAAGSLSERVTEELAELAMDGAELAIELVPEDRPGASGAERAEFTLRPNAGMPAMPLREAASGGELSRVMLALAGPGSGEALPTLVFDEIDAGIGGATASVVGDKLRAASDGRQVIAITHLPQVASRADAHFGISRIPGSDPAAASVSRLEGDAVVDEIARMMGASADDEAATRHARELVASARSE